MATARAIFQAHVDDLLPESVPIDCQWVLPNGVLQILGPTTLASGDNTISFPTNAILCLVVPPVTNINAIKAKGAGGDTGWNLLPTQATILSRQSGTVILNAAGSISGVLLIFLG